jgi:hypothetical protein
VVLTRIPGVESVEVSLKLGGAELHLRPGNTVSQSQIEDAIRKAGYDPKQVELTAVGKLVERGGRLALEVSGPGSIYLLRHVPDGAPELGQSVVITGRALDVAPPEGALELDVESLSPVTVGP